MLVMTTSDVPMAWFKGSFVRDKPPVPGLSEAMDVALGVQLYVQGTKLAEAELWPNNVRARAAAKSGADMRFMRVVPFLSLVQNTQIRANSNGTYRVVTRRPGAIASS